MLNFITDKDLREKVEKSIHYIFLLTKDLDKNKDILYREESNRVIILYVISIIEAVLFFFYEKSEDKMIKTEYTNITNLPKHYEDNLKPGLQLVIATKQNVNKKMEQLSLKSIVNFFQSKKFIVPKTAKSILELNDISNTFHLNKKRTIECTRDRVDEAINLLFYVIKNAPRVLSK